MEEPVMTGGDAGGRPSVSVCIPTYNAGKTLEKCLRSVMDQTVRPSEILVVDGHSQDDTLEVVKRFPAVRVVGSARGIGRARRMLAEQARGDIVAWVDADVMVPRNWLESHLRFHEKEEVTILSGTWSTFRIVKPEEEIPELLCEMKPLHEWIGITQAACTMKRKLFSLVNYDERFIRGEEWDLMVSAHRRGITSHYSEGLFIFHTWRPRKQVLKDGVYAGNYVQFLKKYGLWYIKFNPRHFLAFLLRIAFVYAIPLSLICPLTLLVYPIAWCGYCIHVRKRLTLFKVPYEMAKGVGEHLYLFKIL